VSSATDELRELLDERGVEWRKTPHYSSESQDNETVFEGNGIEWYANDHLNGRLGLRTARYEVTPEQAVAATLGPDTDGRMSGFTWHLMADGWPEKGKNDYIIMGIKGGLYLAPRFEGYGDTEDTVWFRDTRGNHHYPAQVLAWAEIPPLEVDE